MGYYFSIVEETGQEWPEFWDWAIVNFKKYLLDGSNYKEAENAQFPLWMTNSCIRESILQLRKGEKGIFIYPTYLECIFEPTVENPPYVPWVYELELIDFHN